MHTYRLTSDEIEGLRTFVQAHTPVGFLWYWLLTNDLIFPDHCVAWTKEYFECLETGEDLALESFRGSIKSTWLANIMVYLLGCSPHLENLLVQAGDNMAEENTSFMSSIIADQPGWKILFPGLEKDERKWGAEGYEIKDTKLPYGQWRRKRTKVPSIVGGGYKSKVVLGKHPRGIFARDDINDYKNTRSPRELKTVRDTVFKEISPAADRATIEIDVFTPWVKDDIGDVRKRLTHVRHILTPIYRLDAKGKPTSEPTWPEYFPEEVIEKLRSSLPPAEWAQMYMCDLSAMQGQTLKRGWVHWYDHTEINPDWATYIGVDYMSLSDVTNVRGRDWFTLAVLKLHPNNFLILSDGYRGQITRADAEQVCLNWGETYDETLKVMRVENLGKAEEFANWMVKNAPFRVKAEGVKNRSKAERFEVELAPVFRGSKVRVSNEPGNKFIEQFFREWLAWDSTESYPDDTLDSVWHGVAAAKTFIKPRKDWEANKPKDEHPYAGFAAP